MSKVILGNLAAIDFLTTTEVHEVVENANQLPTDKTAVLEARVENLAAVIDESKEVYIPATLLTEENAKKDNVHVYFDLENYPFYQTAKGVIQQESKAKGVFRFRRTVKNQNNESLFASDLMVLSAIFGEAEKVTVRKTNAEITPSHTILMLNFGGGTMAHIEYTVSDHERIELEWSGIKNIIEFDSNEMRPILPAEKTNLPLTYTIDTVLAHAQKTSESLYDQLKGYEEIIAGGADK